MLTPPAGLLKINTLKRTAKLWKGGHSPRNNSRLGGYKDADKVVWQIHIQSAKWEEKFWFNHWYYTYSVLFFHPSEAPSPRS